MNGLQTAFIPAAQASTFHATTHPNLPTAFTRQRSPSLTALNTGSKPLAFAASLTPQSHAQFSSLRASHHSSPQQRSIGLSAVPPSPRFQRLTLSATSNPSSNEPSPSEKESTSSSKKATFKEQALDYHEFPKPGKIGTEITKPYTKQSDLSKAYSPGVALPVKEILNDPDNAYRYTNKGNTVAMITDGSAVLGLGNCGPMAAKPVMEGKILLLKACADIDGVDLEIERTSNDQFVETVRSMSNSFGAINLEDIKAPDCFEIEQRLIESCDIPVIHDDQHGTAITIAAALLNAIDIQQKQVDQCKITCVGAGASGIATLNLLETLGFKREQMTLVDSKGVVHSDREDINDYKARFAQETTSRTLADAMVGADILIGVAQGGIVDQAMVKSMNERPIVFALSNPDPEISPEEAKAARDDIIIATGRSDYPNQVNNVLSFPYMFRGALNVRAKEINNEMKLAAVDAIRSIAKQKVSEQVNEDYDDIATGFGTDYILPKPTDARLLEEVTRAVEQAAIETGAARI